jgi:hypothetical protein
MLATADPPDHGKLPIGSEGRLVRAAYRAGRPNSPGG